MNGAAATYPIRIVASTANHVTVLFIGASYTAESSEVSARSDATARPTGIAGADDSSLQESDGTESPSQ